MRKDNIAVFFPKNLNDLLSIYSSNPEAEILAGALEFMSNSNVTHIKKIISITSVSELKKVHRTDNLSQMIKKIF